MDQLQAQHRNAELTLWRAQTLLKTPAGNQSTVDSALATESALAAQIAGAQAQLRQAEINFGYTEIRAPIDGKISLVSQDPMYVLFSIALPTGLDLRNRYAKKGGSAQS